jgi:hypothetical protein
VGFYDERTLGTSLDVQLVSLIKEQPTVRVRLSGSQYFPLISVSLSATIGLAQKLERKCENRTNHHAGLRLDFAGRKIVKILSQW